MRHINKPSQESPVRVLFKPLKPQSVSENILGRSSFQTARLWQVTLCVAAMTTVYSKYNSTQSSHFLSPHRNPGRFLAGTAAPLRRAVNALD